MAVSKGGKVFTIFSTSKDHNQGSEAMAGCILVDFENLQVINRSHAYRNVYVHRRDSVSIAKLTEREIEERMRLGLVTDNPDEDTDDFEESEEWEDMEAEESDDEIDDFDEEHYEFSTRRSSVIPGDTMSSPPSSSSHSDGSSNTIRFDFTHVDANNRSNKRVCPRFSTITTIAEDNEESDDVKENNMDFDDEKKEMGTFKTY